MATMTDIALNAGRTASWAALVCVVALATGTAARAGQVKASIELFTSQGCSSCPPADKLIGELSRDPSLVTMSLAVDIWDYLGWKDTLALKGHTKRQQAYAQVRGDRDIYTPQVVVNGIMHVTGSDRSAIDRAIELTSRDPIAMQVPITLKISGEMLTVDVPAGNDPQGPAEVWLVPITKKVPVAIDRGENRGHTITYNNVVRRWVKLGQWNGKPEFYNVSIKEFQNSSIDTIAVIIQNGNNGSPGVMLGAAYAGLR